MKNKQDLEIYAPIDEFTDYLVTSHGRVFSLKYGKLKELKPINNGNGYLTVLLCKNSKTYRKSVHRLVAKTFIHNHDNKPQVNHIDEDKTNNNISNLEWVTSKQNNNHGTCNERRKKAISKLNNDNHRKGEIHKWYRHIIGFKINGCDIKYYKYLNEVKKGSFNPSAVQKCCNKEKYYSSHKGYKWYYADEFFK